MNSFAPISLHVLPLGDEKDGREFVHRANAACDCQPLHEAIGRNHLYIHHAFDGREKWERHRRWGSTPGWAVVRE